ncbi:hypothetical protein TNCV_3870751 [Trichonephila clavipes]|nr:hypothetical protein TNCV_3870751 [Trichonephila clavipes]
MLLKIPRVEKLMHGKSIVALSLHVGLEWKVGKGEVTGLDCVQLFVNQHHVWRRGTNVFREVDDVTAEKFCDPAFVDQENARDTFVAPPCRYHLHGHTRISGHFTPYLHFRQT